MPKKLSSAVVGTLAVGLTMPLTANAAAADTAPMNVAALPTAGVDAPATNLSGLSTVDISATQNATQFRLPLAQRSYTYTSPYGPRCMPTQGASTSHLGQDLGAADGSPIYSVAAGTVVRTFSGNRYNTGFVVVQHQINGRTFHSAYLHMWDAHTHVRVGQTVQAGQTISRVGSSGASTGPHLHLEIWEGAWMHGTSHNPTTWLAQRGVDLRASASFVMNITNPSACNYWTVNSTPLRATASSTGSVIMQLPAGATLTAAPGDTSNAMVRVNANGRIGWVAHSSLTPSRPAGGGTTVPAANVPQGTSITPTQYRTTASLNGRSGPGTNYPVLQGLTAGTTVTVTATHGGWMRFSRNGQSVWSHSDFLTRVDNAANPSNTVAASGTYRVQDGVSLRARSGASASSSVVKVLNPGTQVNITGRSGSWVSYRDGSQTLWLMESFLTQASSSNTTSASGTYRVQDGVSLRARSSASTSSSVVKVLNPGTQVNITGRSGSWVSYRDGSQTLWLMESFLTQASSSNTTSASGTYRVQNGVSLRARSSASTSSSVVKVLNPGTQVNITGRSGIWVSYRDGSQTLWLMESFLTQVSSSNTTSASGTYQVQNGVSLRARSSASTSSSVVKVLNPGTQVNITGRSGIWVSYRDGSQTLWLMESFLTQAHNGTGSGSETLPGGPESSSSTPITSSGIYTVNSGVNLNARTGASTASSSAKVLAPGTTITVTGEQNEWVSFRDGSRTLWVHSDFLTQVTESADSSSVTAASGTYRVQNGVSLRARSSASTSSSVVKVLNPGTQVSITGRDGIWVSYRDGSQTLWVMESFLTQATASADSSSVTAASGTYRVQNGVSLRARSAASTSSSVVKVLNPGTQVSITGRDGIWVSYRDGSQTLWVMESFLTQATASADSSSVTAASGTYRVQNGVSLRARSAASTSSSVVKVLNPGTQVSITGRDGIWVSYRDGSQTLWVMESFLTQATASADTDSSSSEGSSATTAASGSYTVKSGINLNARTGPSATSSSAKVLAPGTTISITGKNGEWVSYQDGSRTLWVHASYLTEAAATPETGNAAAGTGSVTAASGTYRVQNGVSLRARSGASTSSSVVKVLTPGTQVSITGRDGIWVSYRDGSQTLWVMESFLTQATASADSGAPSNSPSPDGSSATSAASGSYTVKSGINLNARTGPSATSSSAKVLAPGTTISITGKNGEWVSYQDGSRTLWVHSSYLTQAAPAQNTGSGSTETGNTAAETGSTTAASGTYRVRDGVSLRARSGASTSSSVVKVLTPGTQVNITGRDGIWVSYRDGSQTLWLQESFLTQGTASADTGTSTNTGSSSNTSGSTTSASGTYHVKPNVYLNARSGPGTSHQVVLNLNPLRQFEITGRSGSWVSFVFSGQTVWVDSTFINAGAAGTGSGSTGSSGTDSGSSTPSRANSTNSTSEVVGTAYTTGRVNIRMGPSVDNSVMYSVPTGTKVELLAKKTTGWQEIKVNGDTGWMSTDFLSSTAPSSTGTSGSNTGGSTPGSSGSGTSTAPSTSNMHTKSAHGPYSSAWDKLAQCESGGNWKINTGNGFYGGIQFSPESWKDVGGSGFPHQASKEEQIKRAYMLWKKQGWNAWPHCTSQLGLKGDPGGYGDDYYKVHPSAKTVSSVSSAGTWTAAYSVPLREDASTSSDKLVQIPRGTELKQLQREGAWLKVQYKVGGDTYAGWVNTSYVSQA